MSDFVRRFAHCLFSVLSEDEGYSPINPALAEFGLCSIAAIELHVWRKQSFRLDIFVSKILGINSLEVLLGHTAERL